MYYPDEVVEEVRSRTDIVDLISGYVKLTKKGGNYFGLCPFHGEKTASFSVSGSKQMFHCFGCGKGGNAYTFLMEYENYTFGEAIKSLADRCGYKLPEVEQSEEEKRAYNRRMLLLDINKDAANYFYKALRIPEGKQGMDYFKSRQLSDETMKKFGLGYASKYSNDLVNYLKSKGYKDKDIEEAGLCHISERYGTQDKFWNRVMFPIQDANHKVIGFGGRVMGEGEPKYLNSPETPVFDKSRNLYGLNHARTSRKDYFILCEGYMDVIAMHQAGFDMAVASLGTAFTPGQAVLIKRYVKKVYLAYDSDGAGTKAAVRAIGILKEVGISGRVINMKPYKDPDEFMKALGREAFEERIEKADNTFFFETGVMQKQFDMSDPEDKTEFQKALAAKLCEFDEEAERQNYMEAAASRYGIALDALKSLVISHASKHGYAEPLAKPKSGIQKKEKESGQDGAQKLLLTWLTDDVGLYDRIKKYISPADFTVGVYKKIAERVFADFEQQGKTNPAAVIDIFTDEEEQAQAAAIFHAVLEGNVDESDRERALKDVVIRVKENALGILKAELGSKPGGLQEVVSRKKELEVLKRLEKI